MRYHRGGDYRATPRGLNAVPGLTASIDFAICNNGAIWVDPAQGAIEVRHTIDIEAARELHCRARKALPGATFMAETGSSVLAEGSDLPTPAHQDDPWYAVPALEDTLDRIDGVVEYRIVNRAMDGPRILEAVADIEVPGVVRWSWGRYAILEYNAAAVNKGDALATWCTERGLAPESVVAFGDMPNDASMLAWAGRSFAMAGAQPEAIAAAQFQTASNQDDGVAQAVEALLKDVQAGTSESTELNPST
ncbi:HAD family hydrolase [Salininema proteolyticum]|uniref:HAD family hydrolase n=1 Tax=Salininema proteolyticum TaxID=1607685 RepID=A0ABV8U0W8_9ACTN